MRPARAATLTAIAMVAFAGNSILCRLALRDAAIDPWSFTAIRLGSGALALLPLLRGGGRLRATSAVALFVYALGFSLAYVTLDAGTGALLLFGAVQLTMILHGLRAGERPGASRVAGVVAAAAGVVWLVLPGVTAPHPAGAALMATAGIAWGAYSLRGRATSTPPARATAANFVAAAPLAGVALLVAGTAGGVAVHVSVEGAALAVASGALTSGLGYVVWYAALPGHTATTAAVVQLSVPVLTAGLAAALLAEPITGRLLAAGALTLGGVAWAILAPRRR